MAAPFDDNNPLINPPKLPHEVPALDAIKTEHFLPALKTAIAEARAKIDAIKNNTAPPTFSNTIEALEFAEDKLRRVSSVFSQISGANSNDALRAIESEFEVERVKFGNDVAMDAELFARIKAVHDVKSNTLTTEQQRLLDAAYKGFVRSGALLDDEGKEELRKISERMAELSTQFENNTVYATEAFKRVVDDEAELAGVPARAKALYKQAAEEAGMPGKWLIQMSPVPMDIFEYAENRALREEVWRARDELAWGGKFDNRPVVLETVKLRHRMAQLLGYDNYAAYVLDERMAKTPEAVMEFLESNEKVYKPAAKKFLKEVADYAKKTDGLDELKPWDFMYYSRRLSEETFKLDAEQLRPYFDLEKVLDGVRIHAENLFDINLTEVKGKYPVYHPDVKVYEVYDKDSQQLIGIMYADYYARPGAKRNGAWMSDLRPRGIEGDENKFAFVTNTCNFDKPTKDQPTLLSIDDVRTVFHEFGHALHALLAEGDYPSLTGTNVKWDFVELPSQLQENWVREKEVLDSFAKHFKTGDALPADLIKKMADMENFGSGYWGQRQTFMAMLDMAWHMTDPSTINSVEELEDKIVKEHGLFPRENGGNSCSFGHLFSGGYAAGYYSYKWAEVLDADVFEIFKDKGLYHTETKKRLRGTIYSQGSTEEESELFVKMVGRKPDPDALFRREGLLDDKKKVERPVIKKVVGGPKP